MGAAICQVKLARPGAEFTIAFDLTGVSFKSNVVNRLYKNRFEMRCRFWL